MYNNDPDALPDRIYPFLGTAQGGTKYAEPRYVEAGKDCLQSQNRRVVKDESLAPETKDFLSLFERNYELYQTILPEDKAADDHHPSLRFIPLVVSDTTPAEVDWKTLLVLQEKTGIPLNLPQSIMTKFAKTSNTQDNKDLTLHELEAFFHFNELKRSEKQVIASEWFKPINPYLNPVAASTSRAWLYNSIQENQRFPEHQDPKISDLASMNASQDLIQQPPNRKRGLVIKSPLGEGHVFIPQKASLFEAKPVSLDVLDRTEKEYLNNDPSHTLRLAVQKNNGQWEVIRKAPQPRLSQDQHDEITRILKGGSKGYGPSLSQTLAGDVASILVVQDPSRKDSQAIIHEKFLFMEPQKLSLPLQPEESDLNHLDALMLTIQEGKDGKWNIVRPSEPNMTEDEQRIIQQSLHRHPHLIELNTAMRGDTGKTPGIFQPLSSDLPNPSSNRPPKRPIAEDLNSEEEQGPSKKPKNFLYQGPCTRMSMISELTKNKSSMIYVQTENELHPFSLTPQQRDQALYESGVHWSKSVSGNVLQETYSCPFSIPATLTIEDDGRIDYTFKMPGQKTSATVISSAAKKEVYILPKGNDGVKGAVNREPSR